MRVEPGIHSGSLPENQSATTQPHAYPVIPPSFFKNNTGKMKVLLLCLSIITTCFTSFASNPNITNCTVNGFILHGGIASSQFGGFDWFYNINVNIDSVNISNVPNGTYDLTFQLCRQLYCPYGINDPCAAPTAVCLAKSTFFITYTYIHTHTLC